MALVALALTLVTACQKEEISVNQPDDQITLRTLDFGLDSLQIIHDALFVEINELAADGTLTTQQKNYLLNLLKKLQKAIDRGDLEEANLILEDEFLDYLETLLDQGIPVGELQDIALTGPSAEGTVTLGDVTYNWKKMADGKKWLVQNLRHEVEGFSDQPWFYDPPVSQELFGGLYTRDAAFAACNVLGTGWRLPSNEDWLDLGRAYTVDENGVSVDPWPSPIWENDGVETNDVYGYLVADLEGTNPTDLWESVGFNAMLGGYYVEGDYYDIGSLGVYASSTILEDVNLGDPENLVSLNYFVNFRLYEPIKVWLSPNFYYSNTYGASCRCVHD